MEFIARTVTHPNPKLSKEEALKSLKAHPEFVPGTVIVSVDNKKNHWVANLHEPKTATPPPFLSEESDGAPTDEVKPEDPMKEEPSELKDELEGEPKDDEKSEKIEIGEVMDLVKQIAKAVGVAPEGEGKEPMDDPLPPMDGPGPPPMDGPPKGPAAPKETIHRKAPMGVTPIGSPSFASAKPKMASFDVDEPWNGTIREAKDAIEAQYGEHGYKVKKIREAKDSDGARRILARVSVR